MKTAKITENNLNVIRHRLSKDEVPNYNRLKKIAHCVTKKELREYIKKAKNAYDELLSISNNNNTNKDGITTRIQG